MCVCVCVCVYVCVFPQVKLTGFRSQLEASRVSSNTNELWYNETGGARGVMVIVVGNERGDTRSNPGRD